MKTLLTFFDASTRRTRRTLTLELELADCWLGVFWKNERRTSARQIDVWLCLLPCLPLHFRLVRLARPLPTLDELQGIYNDPIVEPGRKPSARQRRTLAGLRRVLEDELACAPCKRRLLP